MRGGLVTTEEALTHASSIQPLGFDLHIAIEDYAAG
jgi:hypothetical protein